MLSFLAITAGIRSRDWPETCHRELSGRQHVIAVALFDLQNLVDPSDAQDISRQGVIDAADEAGHVLATRRRRRRSLSQALWAPGLSLHPTAAGREAAMRRLAVMIAFEMLMVLSGQAVTQVSRRETIIQGVREDARRREGNEPSVNHVYRRQWHHSVPSEEGHCR
jgi:hypothetical protein